MSNVCICKIPEYGWVVGQIISEKTGLFNRKKYVVLVRIKCLDGAFQDYYEVKGSRVYLIDEEKVTVE